MTNYITKLDSAKTPLLESQNQQLAANLAIAPNSNQTKK
jgi:hypothetical protein